MLVWNFVAGLYVVDLLKVNESSGMIAFLCKTKVMWLYISISFLLISYQCVLSYAVSATNLTHHLA